jgi:hypothetical protein
MVPPNGRCGIAATPDAICPRSPTILANACRNKNYVVRSEHVKARRGGGSGRRGGLCEPGGSDALTHQDHRVESRRRRSRIAAKIRGRDWSPHAGASRQRNAAGTGCATIRRCNDARDRQGARRPRLSIAGQSVVLDPFPLFIAQPK